mmetsp:Transcript_21981/g.29369  ORF Transcript_21981/g.29369 Transcript_21981/m.29369 type:complete len:99 (-) Transcript_21981:996-1292(-)
MNRSSFGQPLPRDKPLNPMLLPLTDSSDASLNLGSPGPNASGASSLASQLNKLSLDNNLTDIEEDENENNSARRDFNTSQQSQRHLGMSRMGSKEIEE